MRLMNPLLLALATAGVAGAQDAPARAAQRAAAVWNASGTTRTNGPYGLAAGLVADGDVAVVNGPVTVAGTIRGSLVAINADVRLAPGARVERDLIVVGGAVTGADSAIVGGQTLQQPEIMHYRLSGGLLEPSAEPDYGGTWWRRHRIRREWLRGEASTDYLYVASRAYNRVEGWSFVAGPRVHRPTPWGAVQVDLFAVGRTASPVRWDNESVGHDASVEVQFGKPIGVALGGRLFDGVQPTETWQSGEDESGLAAALFRLDYRDYFVRHGGEVSARFVAGNGADLTLAFSDEGWRGRPARDPWSLMHGSSAWRPNPSMDEGSLHVLTTRLRVDTRDRQSSALGGWYAVVELEQGGGTLSRFGAPRATFAPVTPEEVWYSRGFVDLRRYNRITPGLWLDLRVAGGGWLAGDQLPTQRRLGIGGPGTLPGYEFRASDGDDLLACTSVMAQAGRPAQCDRVALAQVQLRSRFLFDAWRDDSRSDWWRPGLNTRTSWVLFADAGRGWITTGPPYGSPLYTGQYALPALDSFKVDVGAGVDFGNLGLYWAKAVNNGGNEPIRFVARLHQRF